MENQGKNKIAFLNRDVIKYVAMFTMLLNHIANVFWTEGVLYNLFLDIGYFTAPVMCYFLVEGYHYTKSKKKYAIRLLVFALISQIPFSLAFEHGNLNMIYTLFICFLILVAGDVIVGKTGLSVDTGVDFLNSLGESFPVFVGKGNHEMRTSI